jgi:hypothetical protein
MASSTTTTTTIPPRATAVSTDPSWDRHGDIWALRVQKELLTLTTTTSNAQDDAARISSMLPPYCSVVHHHLDLPQGICRVDFAVKVGSGEPVRTVIVTLDTSLPRRPSTKQPGTSVIDTSQPTYPFQGPLAILKSGAEYFPPHSNIANGRRILLDFNWTPSLQLTDAILNVALKIKESILQNEPFHSAPLPPPMDPPAAKVIPSPIVTGSSSISSPSKSATSTSPPMVVTPTASDHSKGGGGGGGGGARSFLGKAGSSITKAFTPRRDRKNSSGGAAGAAVVPSPPNKSSPRSSTSGSANKHNSNNNNTNNSITPSSSYANSNNNNNRNKGSPTASTTPPSRRNNAAITVQTEVHIGEEINLLEEPWVDAHGVYSCKAIRRPLFVEDAMTMAEFQQQEKLAKEQKSTTIMGSSGGSMLKSLTQTALNAFEESFLMITETHVIEIKSSKLNLSTGKVTFAIPIEFMAKLKFRRQESLSLFFKAAPDDPLVYMCPDSGDAVHQIQAVLKRYGVKGKHTNAAAHRAISEALQLVQEIQTKELALKHDPTVTRVNEIMDLYRQAAERFEAAGDMRHEEVVTHMRKFLALPLTVSILDGSFAQTSNMQPLLGSPGRKKDPGAPVPEGEVLERHAAQVEADDVDVGMLLNDDDISFESNIEKMVKEAEKDFATLQILEVDDDDSIDDSPIPRSTPSSIHGDSDESDELADITADLDAMMKQADDELAELMKA